MRPDDLRTFLHLVEQAAQLVRVPVPVDPQLELATIVEQLGKRTDQNRAVLFEEVRGTQMPVVSNLFGTVARVAWAFGTADLESLAERLAGDLLTTGETCPERALQVLCAAPAWQPTLTVQPPWRALDASAQGLDVLPMIKAWPGDGGAYLTLAQVYTQHPESGSLNCGMYRVQCHDRFAATLRCRPGSGAARHLAAWHARGMAMPVAIALGGPPIMIWAAGAPLPEALGEAACAGYLTGKPVTMSRCTQSDLEVPADAEVVIEGHVAPGATAADGPFGNHTGTYDIEHMAPLLRVLAVHTRIRPMFPWTLVGPPPRENIQLARATELLFRPLVKMLLPTLHDLHMPAEGIFHRAAFVTVDPTEERPLAELASLLEQSPLLRGSRLLVVGAADHDPHDPAAVFWRLLNRVDWSRDLLIVDGRMVVDARRTAPGEAVRSDPAVLARVLDRWDEYRLG